MASFCRASAGETNHHVQTFVSQSPIETFDVSVFHWSARSNETQLYVVGHHPGFQGTTAELAAGVHGKSSWNLEVANQQFEQLCDRFAKNYSTFIAELRKKRLHYLAFLNYPENIRRSLSTTNVVEAINGQLEIMRCNCGGYFHSEDTLKLKLGLAVSSLEQGRWKTISKNIASVLHQNGSVIADSLVHQKVRYYGCLRDSYHGLETRLEHGIELG